MAETDAGHGQVVPDLGGWISGPASGHASQLDAVRCQQPGYVDVRDARHPDDMIHVPADVFAQFAAAIKHGQYDGLFPG